MASPPWGRRGTGDRAQVRKLQQQSETAAVQKDAEKERALARLRQQLAWRPPSTCTMSDDFLRIFPPPQNKYQYKLAIRIFFRFEFNTALVFSQNGLMLPDVRVVRDKIPVRKDPPSPSPYLIFR